MNIHIFIIDRGMSVNPFYDQINSLFYNELIKIKGRLDDASLETIDDFFNLLNEIVEEYDPNRKEEDTDEKCSHILLRGINKGKNCPQKIYKGEYCKKHIPKHCIYKTLSGDCKKEINPYSTKNYCVLHLIEELGPKCRHIKKFSIDGYMINVYTDFIFKGGKVVGKRMKDGSILYSISKTDREIISLYKFPISDELKDKLLPGENKEE